ncbi:uncharacterized protein LOC143925656 [Lithobates pipiens]
MEFLQRHLPRVYQAVQDALNFFTNFTAQVFGAPPDAPQPRNARTNVPIQRESEGPTAPEETCGKKETDLLTSSPELLCVTEENGDSAKVHPGDEDYQTQETDLRQRKSDPGGRRDLEHKITEDVDIDVHTTAEVTRSYEIKVVESTESKNIVVKSHNVQSIINQEQVNPPDLLELEKKGLVGCEIKVSQYEEELTSRAEDLEDSEPLGTSEHKVYKGGQHTGEPSSDGQYEESLFQPITLQSLSFADQKQLVGTTEQEEEEKIESLIEITTEKWEYNITPEQEAQVLGESIDSLVTLEFDVDNILDVIENNKKLVTPVDEPEISSSQEGDSRKTLEDLLETANRLAKHCDLFQKVEHQKGSDTLQDLDETLGSMPASILSTDLGYAGENLTSVDVSLTKSNFFLEQSETKQTDLEEETIKTQSLVLGQSNSSFEEEGKEVSAKDLSKPTNKEDVQGIEGHLTEKQEEKHKFKKSERQPNISKKQRIKKRVHFSPSTEDLFKKSERASRNTLQMVCDEILEGELQLGEDREQLGSSYIVKDLDESPSKEREGNYLGGATCSYDSHYDGQSSSEEEETNGLNDSQAVWYDEYPAQAEHGERCDSLGAVTDQNVHVDFKMEELFATATGSRSTEEHLDHIPSSVETLSVETESAGNRDMSNINNVNLEQTELFTENKNESNALRETVNKSEKESLAVSDGTEETVRKEDSFLEEEKCQVEYLLEDRKDVLECDPTHVKEFIDDIRQSSDTLDTKNVGLPKDFTDEQKQTDNLFLEQAILGQDYPTKDTDNKQLENIIHYSAHRDITETALAENELMLGQYSIQETDKIIKSGQDGKEVQDETFLSDAKDVLKSFEEQTRSSIVQFEDDTLLGQPVSRNGDDEYPENLHGTQLSTSVDEICMSLVGDVKLRDGPPSEEHKEVFRDVHFEGESEHNNETSTNEMEEQPEHMIEKQSYDYKHEDFPPETSKPQEEDSKVKTGHIEVELLTEQQWVAEDQYGSGNEASLTEGNFTEQIQDGNSFRQLAPTDGSEECPEESYETDPSASLNEVRTSIVQDVLTREGLVPEECSDIFKDANFKAQSKSHNKTITYEIQEHTTVQQNDDYTREDFQLDARESQEDDMKVKNSHTEVEFLNEEQLVDEGHLIVLNENSLTEISGNDQLQEDRLKEQPVFRASDEVCHKELVATEQNTSLVVVCKSFVEEILKEEDQVSEEFNYIFKDVNLTTESESIKELMTHEVHEHTSIIQNDDYIHEHSQPNAGESREEGIQVRVGHIEEDIFSEEQLVVHKEDSLIEVSCNDQLQKGKLQGQPVFRDSDEVCHKELVETEQGTSVIEMHTSMVEHIPKGENHVSEEFNDNLKDASFRAEGESIKEIMTHEVQEHTSIIQNDDYIHEHSQPNAGESQEEGIQVRVGHIEEDIFSEEQLVVHKEDSLIEVSCNDQLQEGKLQGQPVFRDSDEVRHKELVETEQGTSVIEMHTSIVEHIPKGEDHVSEEFDDNLKDVSFRAEGDSIKEIMTHEVQEHTSIIQNDDYIHEHSQPNAGESQEEGIQVRVGHIEEDIFSEEQLVVHKEHSLIEVSCNDQLQEGKLQGQPVFRDSDEVCHKELVETEQGTSVIEMHTSIVEHISKGEDHVSEEFNDNLEVSFRAEGESIKEIMTHEVQEHTSIIQNDDYIHEHSQPNAGESQEEGIQVRVGHIEEDIFSEEQLVVHKEDSLIEVSCNDQLQEGKLQGQPVFRDSDEVCHKELVETEQGTSVIEMHTSIVEHIPKGEDHVSEEFDDNLKDVSFRAEGESIKEIMTHEVQEHTSIIQNDDYIHEHSQPNAGESQEEGIQVRVGHIEEDIFSEEQLVVHKEHSLIEVSCNDQLQEGKLQGQPVFRDSDEVCHKELVETEQGTSVIEMHTSIVEHISKGEDHVSEEFNDNLEVSFRAEGESIKEIMTHEVQEHTSIIQNDDYIHEHSQPNAGESQEEGIQVRVGHIEEDIFSEEQLVVHKEDSLIEVSCNDQLQEGKLQGQPVFRDSDEVCHKELVETEQGTSVIEMHTSIVEHIPKGEDHVSEEFDDNLKDVSFRAEGESIKEIMTHEVQEHTSIIQNEEHIHELFQPDARESKEEDIQIRIRHIVVDILNEEKFEAEEQLVVHKEDSLIEVSSNDQLQEDKLQGQLVYRDIDEVCHKEPLETEQSTSVLEICASIVEDILKREDKVSEESNVNFRAERESLKEMMTCEVQEHTSIIENDGYVHEHFQPDATESQEEDTKVRTDHTEVEFLTEEQFVLKDKVHSAEGTRNDQHYEDRLTSQSVPRESNEVSPEKLHETELNKLTGEICTSIAEGVLIENSLVSEEERDVFREVSLIAEGEPHSETSTCELDELQQYTDEEQNDNYIYEDSSIKTRKSQGDDSEASSGHLEVEHLTEEQLVAEGQFRVDNDTSAKDHLQEDRLLEKTVFRDSNEVSPDILYEIEPRTTVNEICTSIVNDVLRDSLVSEESRESFSEAGLKEESISLSDTSTREVKELQDHTAEEQNNDFINEVSLIETRNAQEDDSKGNNEHLEAENVTEEPFVTEEQFKVDNEASPMEGSSIGDQLQEDRILGQSDFGDSDELCHKELFETVQSISVIETLTSVVEDVLITEGLVSEQCSEVIKDADFKTESISLNETTTYEIQEQRSEKQNDYTHEEIQLDAKESQEEVNRVKIDHIEKEHLVAEQQLVITNEGSTTEGSQEEDSKVKIGHIEVEFLCEEQLVAEEQLVVHNEDSLTEVSCNDQLQEDRLQEQPISRYIDEVRQEEVYETEQNTSMVEMHPLIVEDDLVRPDLVSEEFSGVSKDFTSESESPNESITCEVQANMAVKQNSDYTQIDLQQGASESQVEDSKEKIGHIESEFLTGEQFVVTDEPCPAEGSSNDQLKEGLLREPLSRDSDVLWSKELYETELSALENEVCTSFSEDVQIGDVIGSEDRTEVLTEAGLLQESKSYRATSMSEMEEQQEHTAGENNHDHIFEVSLTETSKSQGNDNEVNTVCLEAENITKEQLVSEMQFEVPNEASQIEGSGTDQLQEDGLLQTISKESDEINCKELGGTEQSASVIKLCISLADDILRDSLGSEELSEIVKDTHFKAVNESHNETTTCEIQEQSGERKDNDYTHEDFQPETNESQEEEDGKFNAGHREVGFLTEEQFVVTFEAYQVEKSSNDQMQEDELSKHRDFFKEVSLKTENRSDSKMSTCEVEDLQEHTTEEHNDKYLCEDFPIETSKSQEDGKAKIAPTEVEFEPKEHFVVEKQSVLKNAFLTDEDTDQTEEKHDFSNDTNKAYIKVIEEYEPQLEHDNKKPLKESYEDEGFSHQNTSTGHTIVLDTTAEQENQLDKTIQSHEKELDLLSDINSTIYSSLLDQSISVSSEGTDATLDTQKMESVLYASNITASNLDSVLEVTALADFEGENVSKAPKELDLLSEIQCLLSPDHTVRRFPEIADDFNEKVTVSSEEQSSTYAEEQASEISKDLDSSSGSLLEGPTDNWRSTSDSNDETGKDLLLEIQSVITANRDIKTANFSSSDKLVESDVRVEEEDEKESHLTSGNSVHATEEYVRLETSSVEEEADNEKKVISIENLGFTHEPSQVEDDVSQQDSVFGTVVINASVLAKAVNEDIINTADVENLIQVDINKVQSSINEETTTIYLNEVEYENREHSIKEEYLPIRQTSCHADITRGQEQTLVDETGMSSEPAVQEEDDLDSKVPFHSILDVSAQKSRILLLRKTSVRRRPGQRPVMFPEELDDPPAIPPLNMGVTPEPESSYPTEESTEMSNTSEPLLRRKSSIRRRGQHQATFQEELAGSSALPPLNMGMPPAPESSHPTEEATETSNASEPLLRRKSSIRRRGPRPVTFQEEPSLPLITPAESPHPTKEPRNESSISEQILYGKSSIHQHQGQHPVAFEDEPVEPSPPVITPLKMGVPHFLGGIPILSPAVAPTPELLHPAEEPRDEGTTSEPMLRRKSSVRRPKGKQTVTSEEQPTEPPLPATAPLRMGVALFPGVPAHMTPAPAPAHPEGESRGEKPPSEEQIKPKKGFLKHAGFGGAHPGMMQELQARLHKKKPKE